MTTFDLRRLALRGGEQHRERIELALDPLVYGGEQYRPEPQPVAAELTVTRAGSGTVFELAFEVALRGPCVRCLRETELPLSLHVREYQDARARSSGQASSAPPTTLPADDELRTEYLADDLLDLSAWARDAVALALPEQILCRPECAGLCPVCGRDLNEEPHEHPESRTDPRWAALQQLREPSDRSP